MAVVDYEKLAKEHNEQARQESEATFGPKGGTLREDDVKPAPEMKDDRKTIDPETGRADEASVPRDPNADRSRAGATPAGNNQPQAQGQNAAANPPLRPTVSSVVLSAKEFEGKAKSYLNPDVENGLWDTLDKKIKEALSGNTADEIGQNMAFAAMTFFFDAIGNWAAHHRKEAKRLKKEYEDKTKAFDDLLKNTLVEKYQALAEYVINAGIDPRTPDGQKKIKELEKDKTFMDKAGEFLGGVLHRDPKSPEVKKLMDGMVDCIKKGGMTFGSQGLHSPAVAAAVNPQAAQQQAANLHNQAAGHQAAVHQNQADRDSLNTARSGTETREQPRPQARTADDRYTYA